MRLTHLKAAEHRVMPWKNGLGSTTEIAVFPEGAGIEDFGWRVSMARVAAAGPFSAFPGIDRTLSILEGEGLSLFVGNAPGWSLTQASAPFAFPADVPTSAHLLDGPITDLNVMTRRGVFRHSVERLVVDGERVVSAASAIVLVYATAQLHLSASGAKVNLSDGDAVLIEGGRELTLAAPTSATVYIIGIAEAG